ncbi:unnamed protein product [Lymnaea stagnalis]|uniref:F-box/WD repeat-containing protein 9 n=1 Tax=Lymnaea stagnalis TaxID=6523 RepID=A0AAV2HZA5_LYMST
MSSGGHCAIPDMEIDKLADSGRCPILTKSTGSNLPSENIGTDSGEIPSGTSALELQANVTNTTEAEIDLETSINNDYSSPLTLDQLDDDSLICIAAFVDARTVKYALSQVCRRFLLIFSSESYWKFRVTNRWPNKKYPAVTTPPNFKWDDACVELDDMQRVWSDPETFTNHFMYSCDVFGAIDSVHLMKDGEMVLSGDRNRSLNFIDLTKYPGSGASEEQMREMLIHSDKSHEGWIWCITSVGNKVITGSWDTHIRMFDANAGCKLTNSFKCKSPVLSLYAEDNEVVASCYDKKVYFIDQRTSSVKSRVFHTRAVLCVTGNENFILSGSEDKSISIFDRRAGKIFMMFKLASYPLCLSYSCNQLWFGDNSGNLNLHDGTEGVFQYVGSFDVGHTKKVTAVINTPGAIFTCSGDKTVKVLEPTRDPGVITSLNVHEREIAKIDYKNGVLVSGGGDDCVGVWMPKRWGKEAYCL